MIYILYIFKVQVVVMVATIIYFYTYSNQVDYKIIKSVFVFGSGKQPAAASRLPYSVPVSYSERPRDHAVLDASAFPATHARVVPAQNLKRAPNRPTFQKTSRRCIFIGDEIRWR